MHRAGWNLQLTEYGDDHWRATFYVTGQAHSIVGGSACDADLRAGVITVGPSKNGTGRQVPMNKVVRSVLARSGYQAETAKRS